MDDLHRNCHETLGFMIKDLSNMMKRQLDRMVFEDMDATMSGIHGWLICYLYEEGQEHDIYQKDIEQHFNIRRSSVTGLLQSMEKKGLITRESVSRDARLKKILLTPKAVKNHEMITQRINAFDQMIESGITWEDREVFLRVARKMKENLERSEEKQSQ